MKNNIIRVGLGFLGTKLDAMGGFGEKRHKTWRPTVSLGTDKEIDLDRLELWHDRRFYRLAQQIKSDIQLSSSIEVILREIELNNPWNFEEVYTFLFDFANRYSFKPESEEYFVHISTGTHVAQICLFLLTESRHFPAKLIQTSPRGDSSGESISVIDLDLSRYDKIAQRFQRKLIVDQEILKTGINTRNLNFNKLITQIEFVARTSKEPLLLLGPTGAGKSQLAKQIYQLKISHRQLKGEFVDVNCATIRGEQAMSALFGHSKGAFTGALADREGLLKKADHGLLFLDEIGELGLDEQAMLLRALEVKWFFPLGSDKQVNSNFELIAGTNRDLKQRVKDGNFREDLLHRINTWNFLLPALKDRVEDIEPNLEFELFKYEERTGRRVTFNTESKLHYLRFATDKSSIWSGNFRDLNASVLRMATFAVQGRITLEIVKEEIKRLSELWRENTTTTDDHAVSVEFLKGTGVYLDKIDLFDRAQLLTVIKTVKESHSIADAGRKLFANSRLKRNKVNDSDRLKKYLARFGLDAKHIKNII